MKYEFLEKARENLKAAEICFENGLYNACANRLYYSALQAAVAALYHNGIKKDKVDHKQVQADFSKELIKQRKIFPSKFKSYLSDMQILRNRADYAIDKISKSKAATRLIKAKELLEFIEKELKK